jgi:hypothetical protein
MFRSRPGTCLHITQKAAPISNLLIETAFIHTHDSKGIASCVTPEKH